MDASTEKLLESGIRNTLDELIEATRIAQYNRLAGTSTQLGGSFWSRCTYLTRTRMLLQTPLKRTYETQ